MCVRGRPRVKPKEPPCVWGQSERERLTQLLGIMGFETVRPIRFSASPITTAVVRRRSGVEKGKYPRGMGGEVPTIILSFGPEAVRDMRTAVSLELRHWGLLKEN